MTRQMKYSGFQWIGDIPATWEISKIRHLYQVRGEKNHPDAQVLSLYRELGVVIKADRDDNHNVTSEDTSNYKFVCPGDIVVNKMKAWQGSIGVSEYEGIVSPAYYVLKSTSNTVESRFIHYLLRCKCYIPEYRRLSSGIRIGQWDLSIDNFKQTPVLVPPSKAEQTRITVYLDKQCEDIACVIFNIQNEVEELKKYKQIIIDEEIENGIKNNAWSKNRIKYCADIFGRIGFRGYTTADMVDEGEGAITLSPSNIVNLKVVCEKCSYISWEKYNESPEIMIEKGDVLFVKTGSSYGKVGYVENLPMEATINPQLIVFKNIRINKMFFLYSLQSSRIQNQIEKAVIGGTIPTMSQEKIRNFILHVPSEKEQELMVKRLKERCDDIEKVIDMKEHLIDELSEYRKALIYEYITGKREVH